MERFVQSQDVAWNHLGDSIIAFNLSGEREFHTLNETAALVFQSLEQPRERAELLQNLLEEFDVSEAQATHDLELLLEDLRLKRLIEGA